MDGLDVEIMELRAQLDRTTALAQELGAKRIADRLAIKGFASLLIPKCADGVGSAMADIFENAARDFRKQDASSVVVGMVADGLEEWAADVRAFGPATPSAEIKYLRQSLYELAAKQAATRIIMAGLAGYVGRADGNISEIAREVEQTVRDVRGAATGGNREAYFLIADEIARIADALRTHE
ncbi:hypothetical protein [Sphingomonas sp. PP-CC-3A-396]|uniref:hypothetical protein n=1 Tax=Sphingomonas sp. PP-CC-3A-396 TaxID=2135655 RepID=UPI00104E18BA|nr:hypothetical protein [Sphingomonas sp. PP-CC-3A-396]TCQ04087.1 hypothetical protein C8J40_109222 [Sphingomonas sp. PP-CC-3A-396]